MPEENALPFNPAIKLRWKYVKSAAIPSRFLDFKFEDLTGRDLVDACSLLVQQCKQESDDGMGVILWGQPGRGKSRAAALTLREILMTASHDWFGKKVLEPFPPLPGYYLSYPELIRLQKKTFGRDEVAERASELLDRLYCSSFDAWDNTKVLVLDDVGKEHDGGSGFTSNVLHDLLRSRFDKSAPTIITTNLSPSRWATEYGEAMGSFIKEAFMQVEVKGADHR